MVWALLCLKLCVGSALPSGQASSLASCTRPLRFPAPSWTALVCWNLGFYLGTPTPLSPLLPLEMATSLPPTLRVSTTAGKPSLTASPERCCLHPCPPYLSCPLFCTILEPRELCLLEGCVRVCVCLFLVSSKVTGSQRTFFKITEWWT